MGLLGKFGLLIVILICLVSGIIVLINPLNLLSAYDKNIPIALIGGAILLALFIVFMEKPADRNPNLKRARKVAERHIFERFHVVEPVLETHDLTKDSRGKDVWLLEYQLKPFGKKISLHVDNASFEITRGHTVVATTPLKDPGEKTQSNPFQEAVRRRLSR